MINNSVTQTLFKSFGYYKYIVMNWDICGRKTTTLIQFCAQANDKCVYCVPAYEEILNFLRLWEKYGNPNKKIAILKGKHRYPSYKKWRKALNEAKEADIIVSHLSALYELNKSGKTPYNPEEAVLILDEGDKTITLISTKEFLAMSFEDCKGLVWTNIENTDYLTVFKYIVDTLTSRYKECKELTILFNEYKQILDPNQYIDEAKKNLTDISKIFYEKQDEINSKLRSLYDKIEIIPFEVFDFVDTTNFGLKNEWFWKTIFKDWLTTLFFFREVKIVRNKWHPEREDVFLTSYPALYSDKLQFIMQHKGIIISSGSLLDSDLNLISIQSRNNSITVIPDPGFADYTNVRIIIPKNAYNVCKIADKLSQDDYIVYVINSSYNESEMFLNAINKFWTVATEVRSVKDLEDKLKEGFRVFSLVQSDPAVAMNHRLLGDVAIVRTFIPREVNYYYDNEILLERAVIRYTYQALGRILNGEGRRVALIVPEIVYNILNKYGKLKGADVVLVDSDDETVEKVKEWIPNPIGKSFEVSEEEKGLIKIYQPRIKDRRGKGYRFVIEGIIYTREKLEAERQLKILEKKLEEQS